MDHTEIPEYLDCETVRKIDQFAINELGIPGLVLMENAARGCVDLLEAKGIDGPVIVVCGKGNNGGDGFAIVRHLLIRKYTAKAMIIADPEQLKGDALANYEWLAGMSPKSIRLYSQNNDFDPAELKKEFVKADWIVDALLGTGTKGRISSPYVQIIDCINEAGKKVFAVDIPSGLDGNRGSLLGSTVHAAVTGTFVAQKTGFQNDKAAPFLGDVSVLDIGLTDEIIAAAVASDFNNYR